MLACYTRLISFCFRIFVISHRKKFFDCSGFQSKPDEESQLSQQHVQTAEFIAMFSCHSSERLKLTAAHALQRRSTPTHAESLIITENFFTCKKG